MVGVAFNGLLLGLLGGKANADAGKDGEAS